MGFLDTLGRIPKILEANVNAILDKCENPEKMINQMLVDYKRDLAQVKKDTAEVNADYREAQNKLNAIDAEIDKALTAAKNAIKVGNDADAQKILGIKQQKEQLRVSLQEQVDLCKKNSEQMTSAYNKLVSDISILEARADVAKSKLSSAKAQEKVNKAVSGVTAANSAAETLAKYEDKANKAFNRAQAEAELDAGVAAGGDLINQYAGSTGGGSVDAELAALKAEMGV